MGGKVAFTLALMAGADVFRTLRLLAEDEADEFLVGTRPGCLGAPGDVEPRRDGVAVGVGCTVVADVNVVQGGAPFPDSRLWCTVVADVNVVQVYAAGGKVGVGIAGEGGMRECTRFVGGRSEAFFGRFEKNCIVSHNNIVYKKGIRVCPVDYHIQRMLWAH